MGVETWTKAQWVTGSDAISHTDGVIASGHNLQERTPMGQNATTAEFHPWDPTANDGTEKAVYLTGHDVDTTGGAKTAGLTKTGTFNPDLVNWPAGVTEAQKATAFVGTGISLQKPQR